MKKILISTVILFLFSSFQAPDFEIVAVTGKTAYPFWLQKPTANLDEKLPILVFLHGRSLSGTDLNRVKRYGVLKAVEKGKKINAYIIAPQVASGAWNPDKVLELIEYVQQNYNTDHRVYVCGMSLGGYGTLHFAGKYPNKVTAAVAICGGGNVADACNLAKVPLWIQHGNKDFIVPMSESQKVYQAIKKCQPNADATLTIIPGGNHGSVERLFHENAMYDWLFKYQ
ncbi:phospholipase/carboxylesterase [Flavobacterium croceum DSM 17960]|uniref:Phospholipase/carboxylesterase n=1 Tax=Flavobacterium croceum DSM 17960 TaxID=1121886 RepID=A0A2S4N5F4_9FLAO|nr:dienelactone hydrolase family protein [Flavobacterium croceum]POS00890.1 phospholipase/carboxylesterase [Flavobacterium croceum DSM 17960]